MTTQLRRTPVPKTDEGRLSPSGKGTPKNHEVGADGRTGAAAGRVSFEPARVSDRDLERRRHGHLADAFRLRLGAGIVALVLTGCTSGPALVLEARNDWRHLDNFRAEACPPTDAPKGCAAFVVATNKLSDLTNEGQIAVKEGGKFPLTKKAIRAARKAAVKAKAQVRP